VTEPIKLPEALRLADSVHLGYRVGWQRECAAELRRQHTEVERLRAALEYAVSQNEHDMLLTGDECRAARAALKETK